MPFAWLAVAVAFAALNIYLVFVGYIESDDLFYVAGARGWLHDGLFLGTDHWSIRHCIVLPMAAAFRIFGESEATLVLPSLCYAAALLGLLACIATGLGGWRAAALVIAVVASVPVVATEASLVSTDLPEAFFVIGSVWAWHRARAGTGMLPYLLGGAAAGCAVITRETTAALLVFYLVAFVAGRGADRRGFMLLAAGFLAVAGADWLYLWCMSGDPLYRLHIALAGAQGDGPQMEAAIGDGSGLDRFGSLAFPRGIRPMGVLFLNQNFGLFFWICVPAAAWLAVRGTGEARMSAWLFGGLAAVWLLVTGYLLAPWLWVIPRYYVVCVALGVPLAVLLAAGLGGRRRWLAIGTLLLLVGSNTVLNLGATTDTMAGERALVTAVQNNAGLIHTDPGTAQGAGWLLAQFHLSDRVTTAPPGPGALYFYNSRPRRPVPAGWPMQTPPAGWSRLDGTIAAPKWTVFIVRAFHLSAVLPAGLVAKLDPPPRELGIYRVPGG
jgi:hypothetical protein